MFKTIIAAAVLATVSASCLHNLEISEVTGQEVFDFLDAQNRGCFSLTPSNQGFIFQLGNNISYTDGVQFDACDEFGGCRCQHFKTCTPAADADECDCFTPYSCVDHEGLRRCFAPRACENTAARTSVVVRFNRPCIPQGFTCENQFEELLQASLASCVRSCRFDGDISVLSETAIRVSVRSSGDIDDIVNCIDNQYVGAYDCFAVSATEFATTTTTSTTSTTTTTTDIASSFEPSSFEPSSFEPSSYEPSSFEPVSFAA